MFAKYHYLSHTHNNAASVYVAFVNDHLAGFLSVMHLPHPIAKNIKKVHRLVILPDYQGAGIGIRLLNEVGRNYVANGFRYTIVTSSPSLVFGLKKYDLWRCGRIGRMSIGSEKGVLQNKNVKKSSSGDRLTTSWEILSHCSSKG